VLVVPAHGGARLNATLEVRTVIGYFKCSYGRRQGWSVKACDEDATVHLTDAGGAPWCAEHGAKLLASLLKGKRGYGLDVALPEVMELLRAG
jgi:hypothetical protein